MMSPASIEADQGPRECGCGCGEAEPPIRVLGVEDEYLIACIINDQLAEVGYAVVGPALKIGQARHLAAAAAIGGALLDWDVEGGAAYELAKVLIERRIPVMVVTGYTEIPDSAFRNLPVLHKPFGIDGLRAAIEGLLSRATPLLAGVRTKEPCH
jgi:DNA-binding response OmpR family regulator